MGYGYAYDEPPTVCTKGPRPGTTALRDGVMERFGCGDDGIFNCRKTRNKGSTTLSFHADGRAWDAKCTGALNRRIAAWFVQWAEVLGIQEVISYRRRWDARTREWRDYTGDDPHEGHVHVAQCKRAANGLTLATVRAIEDGAPGPINQEDEMTPEQWAFLQAMNKKLDEIQGTQKKQNDRLVALEAAVKAG